MDAHVRNYGSYKAEKANNPTIRTDERKELGHKDMHIPSIFPVILPILIIIVVVIKLLDSSKTFTGFLGEQGVRSRLKELDHSKYRVINNLLIPNAKGDGTSQIDHVVVFRGGLAVLETKSWAGRVYGKGTDRRWTVVLGQRKYQPENPILQNKVHIRSLQALLGEEIPMHNIVVLSSRADLRLKDVTNAFVIRPREVARTITALKNEVLSDAQAQGIYQRLTAANITDKAARKRYVQTIRQRRK